MKPEIILLCWDSGSIMSESPGEMSGYLSFVNLVMRGMKDRIPFAVNNITCVILLSLFCNAASAVEFNTDVLDAADKKNIDFTRFQKPAMFCRGNIFWM